MHFHSQLSSTALHGLIRSGQITLAGHKGFKIYGKLDCKSGKKMQLMNRVFFECEAEAKSAAFRPCGHCMRVEYKKWKDYKV